MIPELRHFYSAFHRAWPYWLYFCNLETDTLRAMTICCLPEMTTLQVDGRPKVAVTFDPLVLLKFLKQDFLAMNLICEWAEMFEERIFDRTRPSLNIMGCRLEVRITMLLANGHFEINLAGRPLLNVHRERE
jgi:hypothetical protein